MFRSSSLKLQLKLKCSCYLSLASHGIISEHGFVLSQVNAHKLGYQTMQRTCDKMFGPAKLSVMVVSNLCHFVAIQHLYINGFDKFCKVIYFQLRRLRLEY